MLATMIRLRPRRSMSQPPNSPKTPPARAAIQSIRPDQSRTMSLPGAAWRSSLKALPPMTGNMSSS